MANWKLALNSVTVKQCDLERAIRVVSGSGYDGFGFWTKDLRAYESQGGDLHAITDALEAGGLDACELLAVRKWQELPLGEFEEARAEAVAVFDLATRIGAPIVTSPAGKIPHNKDEWLSRVQEICDIASGYDLSLALEFIAGRSIPDLTAALDIVRSADSDNLGVLLDFFHLHKSKSTMEDLSSCSQGEINLVHVDDVAGKPLESLGDKDRRFPGDGVLPMGDLFGTLRDVGYEGYFSIEIFNDEYWAMDPGDVARMAYQKTCPFLKV
jgi:2-keto-myo-inositol isomerase